MRVANRAGVHGFPITAPTSLLRRLVIGVTNDHPLLRHRSNIDVAPFFPSV